MQQGNYVHTKSGEYADFQRSLNRQIIEFWVSHIPSSEDDFHTQLADVATSMNISRGEARQALRVGEMLRRLPKFLACLREYYHVNFKRLATVEQLVMAVKPEFMERIDAFLADYFTPRHVDEVLVQTQTIAKHVKAFILTLDPEAAQPPSRNIRRTRFTRCHDGLTRFSATLSDAEAKRLDLAIRKHERPEDESGADSFVRFLESRTTTTVTLNTFRDPAGVLHLIGGGLAGEIAPDDHRTLDHTAEVQQYTPTKEIRTTVQLLDGTCRYPGCTTAADQCDLDHVVNFDEGGKTTAENLACLCRFHHNQKTSGRVKYSMDKHRIATWVFPNGNTKITRPAGEAALTPMFSQSWRKHEAKRVQKRRSAA